MIRPQNKIELTEKWFEELESSTISENTWLELKKEGYTEIGNKIVGFLNSTHGGLILIGVAQEKKGKAVIEGVKSIQIEINRISDLLNNVTDSCNDSIKFEGVNYKGKDILIVFIESGPKFPYLYNGVIYLREGANTYPVNDKRQIIHLLSSQIDRKTSLRILKNLLKEISILVEELKGNLSTLKMSPSYTGAFDILPAKIPIDGLRLHYQNVESWLNENNLVDKYQEILRRISYTNSKLDVLYAHFDSYGSYINFRTIPEDLLKDLSSILTCIEKDLNDFT